jgi:hypothetical protein
MIFLKKPTIEGNKIANVGFIFAFTSIVGLFLLTLLSYTYLV